MFTRRRKKENDKKKVFRVCQWSIKDSWSLSHASSWRLVHAWPLFLNLHFSRVDVDGRRQLPDFQLRAMFVHYSIFFCDVVIRTCLPFLFPNARASNITHFPLVSTFLFPVAHQTWFSTSIYWFSPVLPKRRVETRIKWVRHSHDERKATNLVNPCGNKSFSQRSYLIRMWILFNFGRNFSHFHATLHVLLNVYIYTSSSRDPQCVSKMLNLFCRWEGCHLLLWLRVCVR